jgi:hypothetical protein
MLYIDPNNLVIRKARRIFHSKMQDFVLARIDKLILSGKFSFFVEWCFSTLIYDKVDEILIGSPQTIFAINDLLNPFILSEPELKKGIEFVFNYDSFIAKTNSRFDAYDLAELLDINTCPYCNRNYTNTVIRTNGRKKIIRPQFDHYFDKGSNPLLALSFHNLIPSCSICNSSIKGTHKMNLNDYIHPYIDNEINNIRFTYKYSLKSKTGLEIKVVTPDPSKLKNSVEAFALEEVYNSHTSELLDLLKTKQYFSDRYLSILASNVLKGVILSKEEIYQLVFGTEYDSANFIKRPFSKFKNDILKELGII